METTNDPSAGMPTVIVFGLGSHPVLGDLYEKLQTRGNRRVLFLTFENYPQDITFTFHQVEGELEGRIGLLGEEPVDFKDIVSVVVDGYYIVSTAEGLSPEDLEYRNTESWAALKGLFLGLSTRCLVANQVSAREHFDSRLAELSLLASYGISVPKVLVTSCQEEVLAFHQEVEKVLYRLVGGTEAAFRTLETTDLARLDEIRLSPVHFEEAPVGRLAGCVKVGNQLFLNPREVELPAEMTQGFLNLCQDQGLHFAELRLCQPDPDADWKALGMSPFLTAQGMEDPEALEFALRILEQGELDL